MLISELLPPLAITVEQWLTKLAATPPPVPNSEPLSELDPNQPQPAPTTPSAAPQPPATPAQASPTTTPEPIKVLPPLETVTGPNDQLDFNVAKLPPASTEAPPGSGQASPGSAKVTNTGPLTASPPGAVGTPNPAVNQAHADTQAQTAQPRTVAPVAGHLDKPALDNLETQVTDKSFVQRCQADPQYLATTGAAQLKTYARARIAANAEEFAATHPNFDPQQFVAAQQAEIDSFVSSGQLKPETWKTAFDTWLKQPEHMPKAQGAPGGNLQADNNPIQGFMTYISGLWDGAQKGDTESILKLGGLVIGIPVTIASLVNAAFGGGGIGSVLTAVAGGLGVAGGAGLFDSLLKGRGTASRAPVVPNVVPKAPSVAPVAPAAVNSPQAPKTGPGVYKAPGSVTPPKAASIQQQAIDMIRQGQPLPPTMQEQLAQNVPAMVSELMKVPPQEIPILIANYKRLDKEFESNLQAVKTRGKFAVQLATGLNDQQYAWLKQIAKQYA